MTEGSSQGVGGKKGKGAADSVLEESTGYKLMGSDSEKKGGQRLGCERYKEAVEVVTLAQAVSGAPRHLWDFRVDSQVDSWRV